MVQLLSFLVILSLLVICLSDCPNTDVLCRISQSDASTKSTTSGCMGGADGNMEGIEVNGSCNTQTVTWQGQNWFDIGAVQTGQCFNLFAGGCQVNNCERTLSTVCKDAYIQCNDQNGQSICQGCQPGNPTYFPC